MLSTGTIIIKNKIKFQMISIITSNMNKFYFNSMMRKVPLRQPRWILLIQIQLKISNPIKFLKIYQILMRKVWSKWKKMGEQKLKTINLELKNNK